MSNKTERPTRRASLTAAVAQALAGHYGAKSTDVAGELALLWEAARDFARTPTATSRRRKMPPASSPIGRLLCWRAGGWNSWRSSRVRPDARLWNGVRLVTRRSEGPGGILLAVEDGGKVSVPVRADRAAERDGSVNEARRASDRSLGAGRGPSESRQPSCPILSGQIVRTTSSACCSSRSRS
jgi:hypothetical protein